MIKGLVVCIEGLNPYERRLIFNKLNMMRPSDSGCYAIPETDNAYFCIDDDGDMDEANSPEVFHGNLGNKFPVYTPQQFWKEFGGVEEDKENPVKLPENNHKMKPEDLEFGHVLHICGTPYVFIKLEHDGLIATVNQYGVIRRSDATTFDEFEDLPTEQRKQDFLKLWRSQGLDFAQDTLQDEITHSSWSVEDLFNYIEQHRERIVEIFGEAE